MKQLAPALPTAFLLPGATSAPDLTAIALLRGRAGAEQRHGHHVRLHHSASRLRARTRLTRPMGREGHSSETLPAGFDLKCRERVFDHG